MIECKHIKTECEQRTAVEKGSSNNNISGKKKTERKCQCIKSRGQNVNCDMQICFRAHSHPNDCLHMVYIVSAMALLFIAIAYPKQNKKP